MEHALVKGNLMESWCRTSGNYDEVRHWLEVAVEAQATGEEAEIPPDYAAWIGFLSYVNACLTAGVLLPGQLNRDEASGLMQLDQVTRQVADRLQRCAQCGAMQRASLTCRRCGKATQAAAGGGI